MTKTKAKKSVTKAPPANVRYQDSADATTRLLVLGFDEQQKPCGARFVDAKPDLVAKAAQLMGLRVYKASVPGRRRGRQEAAPRPALRQRPRLRAERAAEPVQRRHCRARLRAAAGRGRPAPRQGQHPRSPAACRATGTRSRLAISSSRRRARTTAGARPSCSTATTTCSRLRYRDYPRLPKFFRHRTAVALMSPPSE